MFTRIPAWSVICCRNSGTSRMTSRTATCACKQLSVTCSGEPFAVSLCNCRECQRRTGSAFGLAAFFPRAALTIEGSASTYRRAAENGYGVAFHFCGGCGSTVYWEPQRKPDAIAVAVGCFSDPSFPPPSQSVFEEHKHAWLSLKL